VIAALVLVVGCGGGNAKTGKGATTKKTCNANALRDAMGVKALDDYTLQVTLTSVQPWFVQQVAHSSFLAVNRKTVERWGDKWTDPAHIVTDGPFKLAGWKHSATIDLVKNDKWHDAKNVALKKVNGKIIVEGTTRVQAFQAGEVDALDGAGLPSAEMSRLKKLPEYEVYPALGTYYYGFNVKKISDVNQRKAMALAIPRQMIIDKITQDGRKPATSLTPLGMPGYDTIKQDFLPVNGDIDLAKQYMAKVANPVNGVSLYYNNAPGHREIAVTIQAAWSQLGIQTTIKQMEWAQYLEFLGPPPNSAVDVFRNGWVGDFVDDINFLELMTCSSGNNNTNWCNKSFDALVAQAEKTLNNAKRYKIYAKAEAILTGKSGDMPIAPITWYTYPNLEKLSVKDTFNINLLDQFDLTKVKVKGTKGTSNSAVSQEMTIAWGAEPPSLDPGLATDTTSSNVLLNIMDPLVKLGPAPDLAPQPGLAKSWDVKGNVVTFHLRHDARWTNGDPVTAQDLEYSWKRTVSPELGADYAYQFFGIKGAEAYNSCA